MFIINRISTLFGTFSDVCVRKIFVAYGMERLSVEFVIPCTRQNVLNKNKKNDNACLRNVLIFYTYL